MGFLVLIFFSRGLLLLDRNAGNQFRSAITGLPKYRYSHSQWQGEQRWILLMAGFLTGRLLGSMNNIQRLMPVGEAEWELFGTVTCRTVSCAVVGCRLVLNKHSEIALNPSFHGEIWATSQTKFPISTPASIPITPFSAHNNVLFICLTGEARYKSSMKRPTHWMHRRAVSVLHGREHANTFHSLR